MMSTWIHNHVWTGLKYVFRFIGIYMHGLIIDSVWN